MRLWFGIEPCYQNVIRFTKYEVYQLYAAVSKI